MSTARLIECLVQGEVEFVVIGGVAAVLHGSTLVTRDLDICLPLVAASLLKLHAALEATNPRVRAGADWVPLEIDASRTEPLKELSISTDEGRLDCLRFVAGVGEYAAVSRESVEINLGRQPFRVLGVNALIRSKEAAGRPHDLEAIIQLKAIREQGGALG